MPQSSKPVQPSWKDSLSPDAFATAENARLAREGTGSLSASITNSTPSDPRPVESATCKISGSLVSIGPLRRLPTSRETICESILECLTSRLTVIARGDLALAIESMEPGQRVTVTGDLIEEKWRTKWDGARSRIIVEAKVIDAIR